MDVAELKFLCWEQREWTRLEMSIPEGQLRSSGFDSKLGKAEMVWMCRYFV